MSNLERAPLTSILILAHGEVDYSRRALESIFARTRPPYELILVDNGSPDATLELFEETRRRQEAGELPAPLCHVEVVALPENTGFAGGNNRGLERAAGDVLLLLNNDVVVTEGWLEELIRTVTADDRTGLVGPMSNWTSGPQHLEQVGYDVASLAGLERFAGARRAAHAGRSDVFWRLTGFCLLLTRAALERIGGLDEIYGLGNFEDDDLCLRAVLAGYRPRIARGAFVHHFGSRTFVGARIDYTTSMQRNWVVFKKKWGLPADMPLAGGGSLDTFLKRSFTPEQIRVPLSIRPSARTRRAARLLAGGDYRAAADLLESVISDAPQDPAALLLLANACVELKDLDGARLMIARAGELAPRDPAIAALHAELVGGSPSQTGSGSAEPPLTLVGVFRGEDAEADPTALVAASQQVPGVEALGLALGEPEPGTVSERLHAAIADAARGPILVVAADAVAALPGCLAALLDAWANRAAGVVGVMGRAVDSLGLLEEAGGSWALPDGRFEGGGAGAESTDPRYARLCETRESSRFALLCARGALLAALADPGADVDGDEGPPAPAPGEVVHALGRRLLSDGGRFVCAPDAVFEVFPGPALAAWLPASLLDRPVGSPGGPDAGGAVGAREEEVPAISVVIPTRNRAALLGASLGSLCNQDLDPDRFEVLVIDDGSDGPATREVALSFDRRLRIRCLRQPSRGISAAKNRGLRAARAPIVLFFDDDDVADRSLLSEHLAGHGRYPAREAVILGHTTWAPHLRRTEAMHHATDVGYFLFAYGGLRAEQRLDYRHFWGGRASAKRSFLLEHGGFDERLGAEEDIELAWRLQAAGLEVRYWPRARQYMNRTLDFDGLCARGERQGPARLRLHLCHRDPELRRYAEVEGAEGRWAHIQTHLERRKARVRVLEVALGDRPGSGEGPPLRGEARRGAREELHRLYWWCFQASRVRGIVRAKRALREELGLPAPAPPPEVPVAGFEAGGRGAVLIIDEFFPLYDRASGGLRMLRIVERLVEAGRRVVFVARLGAPSDVYRRRLTGLGVEAHGPDPRAREEMGVHSLAAPLDLEEIVRRVRPEVCITSFWYVAEHYLPRLRQIAPDLPVVVDTVDVHFVREAREAQLVGTDAARRLAGERRGRELDVYRRADRLWVVTAEDRRALAGLVDGAPIDVVPNVHLPVEEPPRRFAETDGLLFVGNFQHPPNIDAAIFLLREIAPRVRDRLGKIPIVVAGNRPPEEVRALAGDGVCVTGYVPDLGPLLRSARVSVAPLRYGAGMKGKVGEALSWGLPVVTTSIGAEGMGLEDGRHALIADDADAFADAVARLFYEPALWGRLAAAGPRLVQARWSAARVGRAIEASLKEVGHAAPQAKAHGCAA